MGAINTFDLYDYIIKYNTQQYFETGTGEAVSLSHAMQYPFQSFYSVDIDEDLIEKCKNKFSDTDKKLNLLVGKSKDILAEYVPLLNKKLPVLFFLDAHFPGADFHKISYEESIRTYKKDAFPLEDEIKIIKESRDTHQDVFIIDDFILYESGEYDTIKEGVIWQYKWLQDELNLNTESKFLYDSFSETHNFYKDLRHQGYLIITPKELYK
jgi:hypothetical protein